MNASQWSTLSRMVGSWDGVGEGDFPTIDPFAFREELEVAVAAPGESLHYLQRTWRTNVDPELGSHVETGFITLMPDGSIDVLNSQGSSRAEVLSGHLEPTELGFVLPLHSRSFSNDERMVSSWRKWRIEADTFSYTMGMSTTAMRSGARHLSATLHRQAH